MAYQSSFMGMKLKVFLLPLLVGVMTLTGCQWLNKQTNDTSTPVGESQSQPQVQQPEMNEAQQAKANYVIQCQKELDALKTVNMQIYDQKKASFDNLVGNAAMYRSLRGQISEVTRNTMDALYEFKANQICADIRQSVMQSLIKQGERVR